MKPKIYLSIILLLLFLPFSGIIDKKIAHFFYTGHFVENSFTHLFYNYGEWPAFLVCGSGIVVFLASLYLSSLKKWRRGATILALSLILGGGILINGVLKECLMRPRPKQVSEFGGQYAFRPCYYPKFFVAGEEAQKSLPSGHASMGFYFFAMAYVGRIYNLRTVRWLGIALALLLGGALMLTRVMQGGHFFSDTLISAYLMWGMPWVADRLFTWGASFRKRQCLETEEPSVAPPQ